MKPDKPIKKGFISMLRESFSKSGGCCGAGETCGTPSKDADTAQTNKPPAAKQADKPVQK